MNAGGILDPPPWARAWERIDADFDRHLEEILSYLRRPTVSASDDDMLAGAEHVAALIEGAGGSADITPTAGHPAVLGRIEGGSPRLLRYGMYDVQPADEPVSMLDASVCGEILKLLVEPKDAIGMTLVLITHDLAFAWALADRVAIMYLGKIVELGPAETVLTGPLHPYTRSLLGVSLEVGRRRDQEVLVGEPPDPAYIPPGCRFHPRCPVLRSGEAGAHESSCRGEIPPLQELVPGHLAACHVAAAGDLPAP